MKRIVLTLLVLLSVMMLSGCSKEAAVPREAVVAEKSPAPDITVNSLENTPLKLSDLKGKVVLLNFWATWCPPCRDEIPSMMRLNSAMAGKPFQMVAVSIDEGGKSVIMDFFSSTGFSLPTYIDADKSAQKTYGITGVPETFLIDKNGILIKKVIGPWAWDSPDTVGFIQNLMK